MARALAAAGDHVTVLVPHVAGLPRRWSEGEVAIESFRYAPPSWEVLGYGRSLEADQAVRPVARAVAPLYLAAGRRAVRRLTAREPFALLHAHWLIPNGPLAAAAPMPLPLAIGLHGSDVFLAERRPYRWPARRALARATLVTGCSAELVERVCALGYPRDRAMVIPYGVDGERFHPGADRRGWRDILGIPEDAVVALAVGRMATKKGFHVLLAAAPELLQRHSGLHLVLAGGGDLLEELRRQAGPWADRVHFPGAVDHTQLPDLYRAADLFVLPAVHDAAGNVDGLPNVILEALASALPVVASDVSGIPLALADGDQGRLVPEGDARALALAVSALVEDRESRLAMGRRARQRAVGALSWTAVAARYRSGYEGLLAGAEADVATRAAGCTSGGGKR